MKHLPYQSHQPMLLSVLLAGSALAPFAASAQTLPAPGTPAGPGTVTSTDPSLTPNAAGSATVTQNAAPATDPQAVTPNTSPAAGPDQASGDIIVTASRTTSLASKTPITLTAVTGANLLAAGVTNPTQLATVVPGITVQRGNANGVLINIRGIQSNGGQPSVAFLVDGIYIADPQAQETSFYDLNRVEVLRGPQGTLYGRNTPAGVVNLISNEPTDRLGGAFEVGYGNYNAFRSTAVLNLPATDKLAFRIAGNWEYRDSFYHVVVPQLFKPGLDKNNKSIRLTTAYKPTDNLKAVVRVDYTKLSGNGNAFGAFPLLSRFYQVPLPFAAAGARTPNPAYLNPSADSAQSLDYGNQNPSTTNDATWGVSGELDWKIDSDLSATYLGSYRQFHQHDVGTTFFGSNYTVTPVDNLTQRISIDKSEEAQSHELRLAFDRDRLKAQAGGYFFYQSGSQYQDFTFFRSDNPFFYERSAGVFGQGTFSLTDRWRVTGGVRYTRDRVSNGTTTAQSSKITWKANTDYDLNRNVLFYATIATGYKGATVNQNCTQISVSCTVKPEEVIDYEAGLKGHFLNNKLSANLAGFHYNYTDLQVSQVVPLPGNVGSTIAITNAAAAKIDGAELESGYQVDRHSKFDFTAAWLHARYANFVIQPSNPQSGTYNGDPLDHAPRWTFSGGYTFTQPLRNGGEILANVHTRYSAPYYLLSQVTNSFFVQPAFTKTDINLRYNARDSRWFAEVYVRNIENTIDVTYVNTAPLFGSGLPWNNNGKASTGDPRTFGFRTGVKF